MRTLRTLAELMKRLMDWALFRFLLVGILNTILGYAIYLGGIFLGAKPGIALAVATIVGAFFNYFSTGRLVFSHVGSSRLPQFLAAYLAIYLGNVAALHALIGAGSSASLAQGILLPFVAISSFFIFKFVVFRPGFK